MQDSVRWIKPKIIVKKQLLVKEKKVFLSKTVNFNWYLNIYHNNHDENGNQNRF